MAAEEEIQVRVTEADVSMGPAEKALVTHTQLVNGLVRAPADTLAALITEIGPLNLDDVSIDEAGRIVIDDIEFATALRRKVEEAAATGGLEGNGANVICTTFNALCAEPA